MPFSRLSSETKTSKTRIETSNIRTSTQAGHSSNVQNELSHGKTHQELVRSNVRKTDVHFYTRRTLSGSESSSVVSVIGTPIGLLLVLTHDISSGTTTPSGDRPTVNVITRVPYHVRFNDTSHTRVGK